MADLSPGDRADAVVVADVHQRDVTYSWHHSMIELLGWDITHEGRIMRGGYVSMKPSTDGLADARNKAVRLFLDEDKADWLFWTDTDMGFAPDTVDRLMDAADPELRPVVGGLCFTQREETSDGMGGWRCRATPTIFDWTVLGDGQMGFSVRWDYPPDTLIQCAGTGSACILIHRTVFERLKDEYGEHWYDRVTNTTMGQVVSEDLSMCLRAGALNIPIHVHTGVRTTHQKVLWLAEDDYYAQAALARLVPEVPAATEPVAVLVPTLGRPGSAAPLMESLRASGAGQLARVYAIANPGPDTDAWLEAGAVVIPWNGPPPGTYPQRLNLGYTHTDEPWLLCAADDVRFHPGWLDQAQAAARGAVAVVGTNDLHNPRVLAGEHATHPMVRRAYVDDQGAGWDGPKVLAHEGYRHWYVDDEIVTAAKQRGAWVAAAHAKVEHLHPLWGLADDDDTYEAGRVHAAADRDLFGQRLAAVKP